MACEKHKTTLQTFWLTFKNHDSEMNISPSISKEGFMFHFNNENNSYSMMILDNSGRLIQSEEKINTNGYYFGEHLSAGSYLVHIYNKTHSEYFRIVKL